MLAGLARMPHIPQMSKSQSGAARAGCLALVAVACLGGLLIVFVGGHPPRAGAPSISVHDTAQAKRAFIGASAAYLRAANDEEKRLVYTMAKITSGAATLGDIRDTLNYVQTIEAAAFTDYQNGAGDSVLPKFAGIATNISEVHRLFGDATGEMLEYWKDQNPAHVDSGSRTLKRCTLLTNQAVASLTAILKREEKSRVSPNSRGKDTSEKPTPL